jgi:hypothetical protein
MQGMASSWREDCLAGRAKLRLGGRPELRKKAAGEHRGEVGSISSRIVFTGRTEREILSASDPSDVFTSLSIAWTLSWISFGYFVPASA